MNASDAINEVEALRRRLGDELRAAYTGKTLGPMDPHAMARWLEALERSIEALKRDPLAGGAPRNEPLPRPEAMLTEAVLAWGRR